MKNIYEIIMLTVFILFSFSASVIDIKHKRIPNSIVFSGVAVLFLFRFCSYSDSIIRIFVDMISGFLILFVIRFFTKGKLGMGDVKFAVLMGVFLGFPKWFIAAGLASFLGLLFTVIGLFFGKVNRDTKIPFAPFLTVGSSIAYFINYSILFESLVWG